MRTPAGGKRRTRHWYTVPGPGSVGQRFRRVGTAHHARRPVGGAHPTSAGQPFFPGGGFGAGTFGAGAGAGPIARGTTRTPGGFRGTAGAGIGWSWIAPGAGGITGSGTWRKVLTPVAAGGDSSAEASTSRSRWNSFRYAGSGSRLSPATRTSPPAFSRARASARGSRVPSAV